VSIKAIGWKLWLAVTPFVTLSAIYILTLPPIMPSHASVTAAWKPSEAWLYDRNGELLDSQRVNFAARRLGWVKLSDTAPVVAQSVIAAEDRRFAAHSGVDWLGVAGAIRARFDGSGSRGASTISMQVAAFLAPDLAAPGARGWIDKLRQMRAGMALEAGWSKDHILEAYLNLAGFRGEAQGIGAASLALFGKTPATLTRDEALLLTALLPNPNAAPEAVAVRACRLAPDRCAALRPQAMAALGGARQVALDPGLDPRARRCCGGG
jgi:penicillin-binding protein 1C